MSEETQTAQPETGIPDGPFAGYLNPDGTFTANWADRLPDELRGVAPTAQQFRTLPELLTKVHEFATAPGVRVPGTGATSEEIAAYRAAIGAPETPDAYGLAAKPEGFQGEWDEARGKELQDLLHRHNVPAAAAKELAAMEAARATAEATEAKAYVDAQTAILKAEWGENLGANVAKAVAVAKQFGVDLDKVGDAKLIQVFHKLHTWVSQDDRMRSGMGINGEFLSIVGENPRTKALDIVNNPSNPLHKAYHKGDPDATRQVLALLKAANPT